MLQAGPLGHRTTAHTLAVCRRAKYRQPTSVSVKPQTGELMPDLSSRAGELNAAEAPAFMVYPGIEGGDDDFASRSSNGQIESTRRWARCPGPRTLYAYFLAVLNGPLDA